MQKQILDLDRELEAHRQDPFAHGAMINRLLLENVRLRETFENRLGSLERFRAQVIILGGIGYTLLGAVSFAVTERLVTGHWI